jgi:hypothetical protein
LSEIKQSITYKIDSENSQNLAITQTMKIKGVINSKKYNN